MDLKTDILVVGAGPAGCSAAYHTKKQTEYEVTLCESQLGSKYSKYHRMCGEVVSKKLFDEIFILKKESIIDKITSVQEFWPNNIFFNSPMEGYIIDRPLFLNTVITEFEQDNGKLINSLIIDVSEAKNRIKVKTLSGNFITCKYLIAADGANSVLREKILPQQKVKKSLLVQYVLRNKPESQTLKFYHDESYKGGYKWIFPYGDNEKIGFPFLPGIKNKVQGNIIEKHARLVAFGGLKTYVKNNILFVGDAAAQTNALSKGGIRSGIVAGKMAAESIVSGNPIEYDINWKKSLFASKIVNDTFHKIREMDNKELVKLLNPLTQKNKVLSYLQIRFFYRRYRDIYKAFEISDEVGW